MAVTTQPLRSRLLGSRPGRLRPAAGLAAQRTTLWSRVPLRSKIALALLLVIIAITVLAAVVPLGDPYAGDLTRRLRPIGTPGNLLGTDSQGRDMLTRLVHATGTSLLVGVVPIVVATGIGIALGVLAGLGPRLVNQVVMRACDVMFAFPGILFSLLLAINLGVGLQTLIMALTAIWIAPVARIAETEVLRVRDLDYVTVARASGASTARIAVRQICPVVLPIVLAYATSLVGANIAIAGGLGFIGLGVPVPAPELGAMLQELQVTIFTDPTLALLPVGVILSLAVLFPVLGDGVRDALSSTGRDS